MAATHPSTLRRPAVGFQDVQAILIIAPYRVDSCRRRHDGLCKAPGRGRLMMIRDPGVSKGRRRVPCPALLGHLTLRPPARPPAIAAEQLPTGTVIVHPPKAPTVESV